MNILEAIRNSVKVKAEPPESALDRHLNLVNSLEHDKGEAMRRIAEGKTIEEFSEALALDMRALERLSHAMTSGIPQRRSLVIFGREFSLPPGRI